MWKDIWTDLDTFGKICVTIALSCCVIALIFGVIIAIEV